MVSVLVLNEVDHGFEHHSDQTKTQIDIFRFCDKHAAIRRTDNTMDKRKRTNGQTIYKTQHKTKDLVTQIPLKTGGELGCSGRVGSSYSTSGTCRVNLVTNPLTSHE